MKALEIVIFGPNLHKRGFGMGHTQNKKTFFSEVTKADHKLSKTFYLPKYHMFWLSYESFSILCDVFLLKRVSHNSCDSSMKSCFQHAQIQFYILSAFGPPFFEKEWDKLETSFFDSLCLKTQLCKKDPDFQGRSWFMSSQIKLWEHYLIQT